MIVLMGQVLVTRDKDALFAHRTALAVSAEVKDLLALSHRLIEIGRLDMPPRWEQFESASLLVRLFIRRIPVSGLVSVLVASIPVVLVITTSSALTLLEERTDRIISLVALLLALETGDLTITMFGVVGIWKLCC